MKEYVTQIWGWDEADQQRRFDENFPPDLGGGGSQFFGGEQFGSTFHRADLVRKALRGEAPPAPPALQSPVQVP